MKKFSLLALAAAGLLLGACSDKNEVVQENPVNPEEFEDGAYIGISLSLPSAEGNTTRANDDLSNGIEDEFKVNNATLYIFKAGTSETDEGNAVFVDYVSLGTTYQNDKQGGISSDEWGVQSGVGSKPVDGTDASNDPDTGETNITATSLNEATKISNDLAATIKSDNANNYYAYVILNHNGQIPTLTKGTTTFKQFSRTKFTEIGADIALKQNIYSSGMLMTNAPICNYGGGLAAPKKGSETNDPAVAYSTLVPLDKGKIFSSVAQAKSNPAACVYVERAAVKITVVEGSGVASSLIDGYKVTIGGWKVINTERSYFNTRQINYLTTQGDNWTSENWGEYNNTSATPSYAKFRFVSYLQFLPTLPSGLADGYNHTKGFRTFFAADPNYDVDAQAAVAASGSTPAVPSTLNFTTAADLRPWINAGEHAYTTENTFDVKHQTWRNTTMVTVKTQLTDATDNTKHPDFYTVGKGGQTMYKEVNDVKAVLHNIIMNDPTVSGAAKNLLTLISKNNTSANVKAGLNVSFTAPTKATTGVELTVTPAFTINGSAASYNGTADASLDSSDPLYNKSEADLKVTLESAINDYLASTKGKDATLVSFYESGLMYYNVKIQHFGDPETPWNGATTTYGGDVVANGTGVNVNEIYFNTAWNGTPTDEAIIAGQNKFLGRYGVIRDNWYKLEINGVTKIGSATPEDPSLTTPDTPDDEIENYISVHVHIVPWVLRSQTVIL